MSEDIEFIDDGVPQRRSLTDSEIKQIARQAARGIVDDAVEQTFVRLGIDISKADAVLEFQADQQFMRRARRSAEDTGKHVKNVAVVVAVTFLFTVMGLGLRAWLKQQGGDVP